MKTYNQKVTELITAIEGLEGLLDSDLEAVKPWAHEIAILHHAVRYVTESNTPPVFVEVRGGAVESVYDETGKPHALPIVIDYDVIDSGECPVCANEYDGDSPCDGCGYDAGKDNALACAVRLYNQ